MTNYGPLHHVDSDSTVVDPRFGTDATPTQPAGWGSGGGTTSPAPLTGDTYTAPGISIPAGSLDVWRTARDSSATSLVEVVIFGDSTTYGAADPLRGDSWYSWIQALRAAAWADGVPDGGFGRINRRDINGSFTHPAGYAPTIVSETGDWSDGFIASRGPFLHRTGGTTDSITFSGTGTGIRLTFLGSGSMGKAAYSVDGGTETVVDNYGGGPRASYEAKPVFIGGLSDGLHTLTVRAAGPSDSDAAAVAVEFHVEFIRDTGVTFHKNAVSGDTFSKYFRADLNEAATESMAPFWMGHQSLNTTGSISNIRYEGTLPGPKPAYRNIKLAIAQFGTNDLGGSAYTNHDALATYLENAAYFASTCRAVGCSGLLVAPAWTQLPPAGQVGMRRAKGALSSIAAAYGLAFADFQEPLGYDLRNWLTRNTAEPGANRPHLSSAAYQIQGTWLWENVLAL